ncbi:hypothetical protein LJC38_02860 [Parabacteroides sp. OttesenSCG-928-K15]|nr:hypothetical protein [Parabacteroides sp. OttesenSCG-928-K15]
MKQFMYLPFRTLFTFLLLLLAVGVSGCDNESIPDHLEGKIIGSYDNGLRYYFVQVDEQFPIGEKIEVESGGYPCFQFIENKTYSNIIQVQTTIDVEIGDEISFSCRAYDKEKDDSLFVFGPSNALCGVPSYPTYVITKYNILNK